MDGQGCVEGCISELNVVQYIVEEQCKMLTHVQDLKCCPICTIQDDDDESKPPRMLRREKVRIASSWVVQEKSERVSLRIPRLGLGHEFQHGPDTEPQEDRVA